MVQQKMHGMEVFSIPLNIVVWSITPIHLEDVLCAVAFGYMYSGKW